MAEVDVIFERKVLFTYSINLAIMNGPQPAESEYVQDAKRCAVEDGLLTAGQVDKAEFRIRP